MLRFFDTNNHCLFCNTSENINKIRYISEKLEQDYKNLLPEKYQNDLDFNAERNFIYLCKCCHKDFNNYLTTILYNPLYDQYIIYSFFNSDNKIPIKNISNLPNKRLITWRLAHCSTIHEDLISLEESCKIRDISHLTCNLSVYD